MMFLLSLVAAVGGSVNLRENFYEQVVAEDAEGYAEEEEGYAEEEEGYAEEEEGFAEEDVEPFSGQMYAPSS